MEIQPGPISADELMAFVDGVLDADRAQMIEQQAQHDGELAATLAVMRAQQPGIYTSPHLCLLLYLGKAWPQTQRRRPANSGGHLSHQSF